MEDEALSYNFKCHFNGKEDCKDFSYLFKCLVPFSFIVTVVVLIYSQYDCVQKYEQNYNIFEEGGAGEVD